MSNIPGTLYIVSTPIGNLGDISQRAIEILNRVAVIAVEDTRHARRLLEACAIRTPTMAVHEHNEREQVAGIVSRLSEGQDVALISDAGTPLVSDPGFVLVREVRSLGYRVSPVPGASALLAALSVAGMPTDRFVFEGFLPNKSGARQHRLDELKNETRTLVFYEAPHRILASLQDMSQIFGAEREAVLARELTKTFETVKGGSLQSLHDWVAEDPNQQKGEIVMIVHGASICDTTVDTETRKLLQILLEELPLKQAASLAARISGNKKNLLYNFAIKELGVGD